jgi:hypothetical protein
MATDKGWTLDNQAVGATTCGDLTTQGRSESLWDLKIDANSVNIYAHFHNEEANWGFEASGVYYTRNCIEAQTAWLAIPESQKVRAINCAQTGTWTAGPNSAAAITTDTGATLTCTVTGTVVYLSTARTTGAVGQIGTYSITVDGNLVTDTESQSTLFSEYQNVSPQAVANFVRVGNLQNTTHTINYTCTFAGSGCAVFYAAGLTGGTNTPIAYSLSPVPNASTVTGKNFDPATYAQYYAEWKSLVTELQGDGLNIIPIDVNNPKIYDPNTQSQPDGIHETVAGHAAIGNYAATL